MADITKAYSYLRFSTPEQSRGDSFRRQSEASLRYAEENGLELDTRLSFQDLGRSAYRGSNTQDGALGDFIQAVDQGLIEKGSYLLVESLDRLSREAVLSALSKLIDLLNKGVRVVTLSDQRVHTLEGYQENFSELMFSLMIMARAHEESAMKGKRVGAAWANKRKRMADGHKLTKHCPSWLELNDEATEFKVLEDRVEIIRRIYDMSIQGIGKERIVRILNEEGVPTFARAKGWYPSYIQRILETDAVLGHFQPCRLEFYNGKRKRVPEGDLITDYYPPIIDRETYATAKAMREGRRIGGGKKGKRFSNLFTGIATCGNCGKPMHYANKGNNSTFLICSVKRCDPTACDLPTWRYIHTERAVLLSLPELDVQDLFPTVHENIKASLKAITGRLTVTKDDLKEVSSQVENALILLLDRPDSPAIKSKLDELETKQGELKDEIEALEKQERQEKVRLSNIERDFETTIQAIKKFDKMRNSGDVDEVFSLRSQLHQTLKATVENMIFMKPQPPYREEEAHGEIHVTFKDAPDVTQVIILGAGDRVNEVGRKTFKSGKAI